MELVCRITCEFLLKIKIKLDRDILIGKILDKFHYWHGISLDMCIFATMAPVNHWQCCSSVILGQFSSMLFCFDMLLYSGQQRYGSAIHLARCGNVIIKSIHDSHNAPVPYPTMLHSEQKCAHFCTEWCIVGYGTSVQDGAADQN